jgi:hypothetical protein
MPPFIQQLLDTYQPFLLTLVGLIVLDVLLGIASGLRQGQFQWSMMANFYKTDVLPDIIGWVAFVIATYLVAPELLGNYAGVVSQGVVTLAWGTIVVTLGVSIAKSAAEVLNINIGPLQGRKAVTPPTEAK